MRNDPPACTIPISLAARGCSMAMDTLPSSEKGICWLPATNLPIALKPHVSWFVFAPTRAQWMAAQTILWMIGYQVSPRSGSRPTLEAMLSLAAHQHGFQVLLVRRVFKVAGCGPAAAAKAAQQIQQREETFPWVGWTVSERKCHKSENNLRSHFLWFSACAASVLATVAAITEDS